MTNFTIKDLPKNRASLVSFLRNREYLKKGDKLVDSNLVSVYNTRKVITALTKHILDNNTNLRFKKHFSTWDNNLNILKGLLND